MAFLRIKTNKAMYYVECIVLKITDDYIVIKRHGSRGDTIFLSFNKILEIDNKNDKVCQRYFENENNKGEYLESIINTNNEEYLFRW